MGQQVLMVSPDGQEMVAVDESLVEALKAKGARPVRHNARLLAKYADMIPALAATAGGTIGLVAGGGPTAGAGAIPGAMAGGALGGGIGELGREAAYGMLNLPTPKPMESLGNVAHEAGMGGILAGLAEVPTQAFRLAGRGLMTSAIKPGSEAALDAAEKGRVAVGRPFTPWGKTGAEQIAANTAPDAAKLGQALARADASGQLIPRAALMQRLKDVAAHADAMLNTDKVSKAIGKMTATFEGKYPDMLTPSQVQEIKKLADEAVYEGNKALKVLPGKKLTADVAWNQAVGNDARGALSGIPTYGPDIARANANMGPQLRLLQDVQKSEGMDPRAGLTARPEPFHIGGMKGIDVASVATGGSGRLASRVGLGLTHPAVTHALYVLSQLAPEYLRQQGGADPRVFQNVPAMPDQPVQQ